MKVLFPAFFALLILGCREHHSNGVSLTILDASVKREAEYLDVACTAAIENRTGSYLTVTSSFFSAFDGLSLLVTSDDGKLLATQGYAMHRSPSTVEGRPFVLTLGRTTQEMRIPVFALTNAPDRIGLQLVGHLPHSSFTSGLTSGVVRVAVK